MKDSTAKASVVDEILEFNRDREPKLVRRKFRRMTKDPFAFFRGTDQSFATHWTRLAPPDVAPSVLICGDLHLENYGAYRTDEGYFLYDINDYDSPSLPARGGLLPKNWSSRNGSLRVD